METTIFLTLVCAGFSFYFWRNDEVVVSGGIKLPTRSQLYLWLDRLTYRIAPKLSRKKLNEYRQKLQWAGNPWGLSAEMFYTAKLLLIFTLLPIGLLVYAATKGLLVLIICAVCSLILPDYALNKAVKKRQDMIKRSLLDAVELLWVPCDSGMSLIRAVKHLSNETDNIVIQEMNRCYMEIDAGKGEFDAIKDLVFRNGVPELEAFVQAVQHNQKMGTSISEFLLQEAERIRNEKRSKIQEAGQSASTKVLVATVVFMGPALLIMMFGPILKRIDFANIINFSF